MFPVELGNPIEVKLRVLPDRGIGRLVAVHRHIAPGDDVANEFLGAAPVDAGPIDDRAHLDWNQPRTLPRPKVRVFSRAHAARHSRSTIGRSPWPRRHRSTRGASIDAKASRRRSGSNSAKAATSRPSAVGPLGSTRSIRSANRRASAAMQSAAGACIDAFLRLIAFPPFDHGEPVWPVLVKVPLGIDVSKLFYSDDYVHVSAAAMLANACFCRIRIWGGYILRLPPPFTV